MSFVQKENSGSLFVNRDKDKANPEHQNWADRKGTLNVGGKIYYINGWLKQDKNGNPYMSLTVKLAQNQPAPQQQSSKRTETPSHLTDDGEIPF